MGRPLNKKFFGSPEKGGLQMVLSYVWLDDSTGPEEGFWVVRQLGTGRYQVTDGDRVGAVRIVGYTPTQAGEGAILVFPFGAEDPEYARKIHNRSVVTWSNNTYKWFTEAADEDGQADFILDTWEDPLEVGEEPEPEFVAILNSVGFEGGVGYFDNIGSLNDEFGLFADFTVIGLFEDGISKLYLQGDHPEIASVEITINGTTIVYGYAGNEGNTEFLSEDSFGFEDGVSYTITEVKFNDAP